MSSSKRKSESTFTLTSSLHCSAVVAEAHCLQGERRRRVEKGMHGAGQQARRRGKGQRGMLVVLAESEVGLQSGVQVLPWKLSPSSTHESAL